MDRPPPDPVPSLGTVGREWLRIGLVGFGGPPAHIALLRELVVDRRRWMDARTFEDANAVCQLLPGPASTQLALFCAQRLAGLRGLLLGGAGFVAPAVVLVLALSVVFLADAPPDWVRGAGAGAGAATVAVAAHAGLGLLAPGWRRTTGTGERARWALYVLVGLVATVVLGPFLVLALLAAGAVELGRRRAAPALMSVAPIPLALLGTAGPGLLWTALKVGALSYGGGFVIIPLMRGDAVGPGGWMSAEAFLNAVALGQVTPGPVVATVAAVGYAAGGLGAGLLAALVAFGPSFVLIAVLGGRFDRVRDNADVRAFLDGAGPAAAGAILGAAIVLALSVPAGWLLAVAAWAAIVLFALRRGVVLALVSGGVIAAVGVSAGAPL